MATLRESYNKADVKLGGYLPGGVTPEQVKQESQQQSQQQSRPLQEVIKPPTTPLTPYLPTTPTKPSAPTRRDIGGDGGYSYVESTTGKGYEVSPAGERKEIIPIAPAGRTLSSQFETSVQPTEDYGYIKPYEYTLKEAAKESLGNIKKNIFGWFLSGKDYEPIFEPYKKTGLGFANIGIINLPSPLGLNVPKIDYSVQTSGTTNYLAGIEFGKSVEQKQQEFSGLLTEKKGILSTQAQEEYSSGFDIAQTKVTSGEWNLETGERYLGLMTGALETKYGKRAEDYQKQLQKQFEESIIPLEKTYKGARAKTGFNLGLTGLSYGADVGTIIAKGAPFAIETGALIGGGWTVGTAIGAKEIILGGKEQDIFRVAGGASIIGLTGIPKFRSMAREISVEESLGALEKQSFKLGELRFTGETDLSIVKGFRQAGGLRQEINVAGGVIKERNLFIQPGSKFVSTIGGKIESAWGGGLFGVKPQSYVGVQIGEIGAKGISVPLEETGKYFATFGRGTIAKGFKGYGITTGFDKKKLTESFYKNAKFFENQYKTDYFAGVSKQLKEDFFVSRTGRITGVEYTPTKEVVKAQMGGKRFAEFPLKIGLKQEASLRIDATLKDITFTKIIPKSNLRGVTSVDFSGTKSGLQGLTQIPKTSDVGAGLVTKAAIQEFKGSLVPKLTTKTTQISAKGFGGFSVRGLSSIQVSKTKNVYGTQFGSLGLTSGLRFKESQLTGVSPRLKQPSASAQGLGLSQLQLSKTDLGLRQITPQKLVTLELTGFGGGFGGLGLFGGGFELPQLGAGLGISKPRRKGKKRKTKIKPSFTASVFDIRGALPKGGTFGISPFQLRKIPKSNKNYFNIGI